MNRKLELMELADHGNLNLHGTGGGGGGGGLRAPLPSMGQDLMDSPTHPVDAVRGCSALSADGVR
jgi:hypothetical protein